MPGNSPRGDYCLPGLGNNEDAISNAIPLGGDSDTLARVSGGIAEAYHGRLGQWIEQQERARLTPDLLNHVAK